MKTIIDEIAKKMTMEFESKAEMKSFPRTNRSEYNALIEEWRGKGYMVVMNVTKKAARKNNIDAMFNNMKASIKGGEDVNFSKAYYNHGEATRYGYRYYHLNEDGSKTYMK